MGILDVLRFARDAAGDRQRSKRQAQNDGSTLLRETASCLRILLETSEEVSALPSHNDDVTSFCRRTYIKSENAWNRLREIMDGVPRQSKVGDILFAEWQTILRTPSGAINLAVARGNGTGTVPQDEIVGWIFRSFIDADWQREYWLSDLCVDGQQINKDTPYRLRQMRNEVHNGSLAFNRIMTKFEAKALLMSSSVC